MDSVREAIVEKDVPPNDQTGPDDIPNLKTSVKKHEEEIKAHGEQFVAFGKVQSGILVVVAIGFIAVVITFLVFVIDAYHHYGEEVTAMKETVWNVNKQAILNRMDSLEMLLKQQTQAVHIDTTSLPIKNHYTKPKRYHKSKRVVISDPYDFEDY